MVRTTKQVHMTLLLVAKYGSNRFALVSKILKLIAGGKCLCSFYFVVVDVSVRPGLTAMPLWVPTDRRMDRLVPLSCGIASLRDGCLNP
jgi:hypothetical protein